MRHLTEGELRRYYDDPDAIVATERSHFASCTVCQDRLHAVAADAKRVRTLLETAPAPVDARVALSRFHSSHREKAGPRPGRVSLGRPALRWQLPATGAVLAVAVIAMFTVTPFAASLRGLFVPTTVQPVTVTQGQLESLSPLSTYGTISTPIKATESPADSAEAAAATTGLPPLQIGNVPSSVAGQPTSYETVSQGTTSFTFDATKAAAAAQQAGQSAPSFPPGVDGSSLVVQTGPGEAVLYGNEQQIQQALQQSNGSGSAAYQQAAAAAGTFMVAGEMRAPAISSTGAAVDQIKHTLLHQPNLSPQAKALIKQLGDAKDANALPIPVPVELGTAQQVTVQGVQGEAFGDNTGIGSAVIWINNGIVYFVGGTITETDALAAANSLS